MGNHVYNSPTKRPSSKPLWIAVAVIYGIYATLYGIGIYANWRGIPLP